MVSCAVNCCKNHSDKRDIRVKYHTFPKDKDLQQKWVKACNITDNFNINNARVCSQHFCEEDWMLQDILLNIPLLKRRLKKGAIPTRNLDEKVNVSNPRDELFKAQERRKEVQEIIANYDKENQSIASNQQPTDIINLHYQTPGSVNVGVQTENDPACIKDLLLLQTQEENSKLKRQLKHEKEQNAQLKKMEKAIENIFSVGQIKKLKNGMKKIKWSSEDISAAISLYISGPKAYRYMYKLKYPLPCTSVLRKWAAKFKIRPGILENVMHLLRKVPGEEKEKLCVLSFDEMKIRSIYEYDKSNDTVMRPSNYVQVVMIRGILKSWKQVIYYNFDTPMTSTILFSIIRRLEEIAYTVVAVVSDMGPTNLRFWREVSISEEHPYFKHPSDPTKKIFVFADVPHLIKLLRNHFLDQGFILDGKIINSDPIKELLIHDVSDLKIAHKLTRDHIDVKQAGRQKVKTATQLFSHSVSKSIERCITFGIFSSTDGLSTSKFIKDVNDWFDIFNSRCPTADTRPRMKAYGLCLHEQTDILLRFGETIKNIRAIGKKSLLPFQKGILLSNSSLISLYEYMKCKYEISYIITNRLNQDILENFFGIIRAKGGLNDHPSPLEFKYRLRSYILGRSDSNLQVSEYSNVDNNTEVFEEHLITKKMLHPLFHQNQAIESIIEEDEEAELDISLSGTNDLHGDGLEYLAGYLIKRCNLQQFICSSSSHLTWVNTVSEGGLIKPTAEFIAELEKLESIFNKLNEKKYV